MASRPIPLLSGSRNNLATGLGGSNLAVIIIDDFFASGGPFAGPAGRAQSGQRAKDPRQQGVAGGLTSDHDTLPVNDCRQGPSQAGARRLAPSLFGLQPLLPKPTSVVTGIYAAGRCAALSELSRLRGDDGGCTISHQMQSKRCVGPASPFPSLEIS